jgi:hypothetical protein
VAHLLLCSIPLGVWDPPFPRQPCRGSSSSATSDMGAPWGSTLTLLQACKPCGLGLTVLSRLSVTGRQKEPKAVNSCPA